MVLCWLVPLVYFPWKCSKAQVSAREPLLFQRVNDDAFTAFGKDSRIAFAFNPMANHRNIWAGTLVWNRLGAIRTCWFCAVALSVCIIWPIRPLIRRLQGKRFQVERRLSRAWWLQVWSVLWIWSFWLLSPVALANRRMEACVAYLP